jgi:pimeloyl-ACP methyl ester carboxylesterase
MSKLIGVFAIVACWLLPIPCGGTHDYSSPSASSGPHYERPRTKAGPYKERAVVFVHGLFGDADSTWRYSPTVYWPQLLTTDDAFQDADVYVASYASPYSGNKMSLDEVVTNLNNRLVSDEVFSKHREIVFVCHSLGGLVVQRLLLTFRDYAQKVSFIYFFSTPETGAQIANVARIFSSDPLLKALLPGMFTRRRLSPASKLDRSHAIGTNAFSGIMIPRLRSGFRQRGSDPLSASTFCGCHRTETANLSG